MKIFAVGLNYAAHNLEMEQKNVPVEPVIFMKPDTALLKDGNPFFYPDFSSEIHYETELVVRINRLGKNIAERFAHRYYNEITLGIDFTARDLQRKQKQLGLPWEVAKGFDSSAAIGSFISLEPQKTAQTLAFHLTINDQIVQKGFTHEMIFSIDEIIAYISRFFTLKIGDLIFTGTPAGVGPVAIGDHLEGYLEDKKVMDFYIR